MRIHTNTLTLTDVTKAAMKAGVTFASEYEGIKYHGSRKRDHAWNVLLRGNSKRRPNSRHGREDNDYAATWDQWGIFLAELYAIDPELVCPYYASLGDFHWRTDYRFDDLTLLDSHGDHVWIVGVPFEQSCKRCTAVRRWGPRAVAS